MNTASSRTPSPSSTATEGCPQPPRDWTSPASRALIPPASSTMPTASTRRSTLPPDSASTQRATPASTAAAPAVTQYVVRQLSPWSSATVTRPPSPVPAPMQAPQTAAARERAGPAGKAFPISPSALASTAAPPPPSAPRPAMKTPGEPETATSTAPRPSSTRPPVNTRRRPRSSASTPAVSSAAARPTLIALSSQAWAPGPASSVTVVRTAVASGVTKVISTSSVASEAISSVRACSGVARTTGARSASTRTAFRMGAPWFDDQTQAAEVSVRQFDVQTWTCDTRVGAARPLLLDRRRPGGGRRPLVPARRPGGVAGPPPVQRDPRGHRRTSGPPVGPAQGTGRGRRARAPAVQRRTAALGLPPHPGRQGPRPGAALTHGLGGPVGGGDPAGDPAAPRPRVAGDHRVRGLRRAGARR